MYIARHSLTETLNIRTKEFKPIYCSTLQLCPCLRILTTMDHVYCGPIYKERDTMNPNTYSTIIIGHTLAKRYDTVMEVGLSRSIAIMGLKQQNK